MSPAKQKALLLDTKTKEFAVGDVEVYKPGPGEVLIKIQAAALNPVDWKIQRSSVGGQFPEYRILGEDISGDVVEVGKGVTNFKEGDRVFAETEFGKSHGGFQQYALSLASVVAKIPPGISYDEAATIPLALSTSYVGLHHQVPRGLGIPAPSLSTESRVRKRLSWCLEVAARWVNYLAKLSGLSPIITTASLKHTEHLKALGATNVLDRNLSIANISQRVKEITKSPILRVVDAISLPSTQELASALLASGGYLAVVLSPAVEAEGKTVIRVSGVLRAPGNIEILEDLYQNKASVLLESGAIRPLRYEVLPNGLAGISDGLARMEGDQISGVKLVAHPQETV